MSTFEGRDLNKIFNCLCNTNYSIQLAHTRPTMHCIRLVIYIYKKSQFSSLVWGSLMLTPIILINQPYHLYMTVIQLEP